MADLESWTLVIYDNILFKLSKALKRTLVIENDLYMIHYYTFIL